MVTSIKYPHTPHLPWSASVTEDDFLISQSALTEMSSGRHELVVTEKMDGGNVTFAHDAFYSRSPDAHSQPWDHRAKAVWASCKHMIPEGLRISAESMHARRSVGYENLPGAALVFGAWDDTAEAALAWDDVEAYAQMLLLPTVPVLYRGYSFIDAVSAWGKVRDEDSSEGFVVRYAEAFVISDFKIRVAKYVRPKHVRTSDDWRRRDDYELNHIVG